MSTSQCLLSSASSQDLITECSPVELYKENSTHKQLSEQPSEKPACIYEQERLPVYSLDKAQKERLIARTAQALGLTSREWTATSTKRQINCYPDYSRPHTQQERKGRPPTREIKTKRPSTTTQQDDNQQLRQQDKAVTTPSTRVDQRTGGKSNRASLWTDKPNSIVLKEAKEKSFNTIPERAHSLIKAHPESKLKHKKLDQLKSIYKSSHRLTSSTPSHFHTHPHTQTHNQANELMKMDTLDRSSYWNELRGHRSSRDNTRRLVDGSGILLSQQPKHGKMIGNKSQTEK